MDESRDMPQKYDIINHDDKLANRRHNPNPTMHNIQHLQTFMTHEPQGLKPTNIPNVQVFWSQCAVPRHLQEYPFGLVFIIQGYKIGYMGERRFQYGAGHYLAIGLPIHFECETHVQNNEPLLGLFVHLDFAELSSLAAQMLAKDALPKETVESSGVEPLPITESMNNVLERILEVINQPDAGSILGVLYVRELCYHILQEANSAVLLNCLYRSTPQNRVAQTLGYLNQNLQHNPSVPELAQQAHMSTSSYNRHFKQLTGRSVMQYSKTLRLMRARHLLTVEGQNVSQTAEQVGYGSAAQLSRDFKMYFGVPPKLAGML